MFAEADTSEVAARLGWREAIIIVNLGRRRCKTEAEYFDRAVRQ